MIISQDPYVFVPNSAEPRCDHCFASTHLRRCSACQAVWYCGSSCQVCSIELAISVKLPCLDIVSHYHYAQTEIFGGQSPDSIVKLIYSVLRS